MKLYSLCTHRSLKGNRANAQKVMQALLAKGWRVGTIWECALRGKSMMKLNIFLSSTFPCAVIDFTKSILNLHWQINSIT